MRSQSKCYFYDREVIMFAHHSRVSYACGVFVGVGLVALLHSCPLPLQAQGASATPSISANSEFQIVVPESKRYNIASKYSKIDFAQSRLPDHVVVTGTAVVSLPGGVEIHTQQVQIDVQRHQPGKTMHIRIQSLPVSVNTVSTQKPQQP